MAKHKTKIIAAVVIVVLLAAAWAYGGNYNKSGGAEALAEPFPSASPAERVPALPSATPIMPRDNGSDPEPSASGDTAASNPAQDDGNGPEPGPSDAAVTPKPTQIAGGGPELSLPGVTVSSAPVSSPSPSPGAVKTPQQPSPTPTATSAVTPSPTQNLDPKTGLDQYLTGKVPEGKPLPVEPDSVTMGSGSFTVTLSVRCDTILNNMRLLDKEKHELVPEDGVIFPATSVTVYEGESVFNILQREMRRAGIHMTFRNTPIYNSAYIVAINNLEEFDVGELSGWMYQVNGWYPNYGCSRYQLRPGDVIEWNYTCDLGRDLGQYWLSGGY